MTGTFPSSQQSSYSDPGIESEELTVIGKTNIKLKGKPILKAGHLKTIEKQTLITLSNRVKNILIKPKSTNICLVVNVDVAGVGVGDAVEEQRNANHKHEEGKLEE